MKIYGSAYDEEPLSLELESSREQAVRLLRSWRSRARIEVNVRTCHAATRRAPRARHSRRTSSTTFCSRLRVNGKTGHGRSRATRMHEDERRAVLGAGPRQVGVGQTATRR